MLADDFFKTKSTLFRIQRQGDTVTASYSHDGKEWTSLDEVTTVLPAKVQVGIAAINTSDSQLSVQFKGLKVTTKE